MKQLKIPEIDLNKELNKCKSMEDPLGREKYERDTSEEKSYRNGYSPKNIKTSFGEVSLYAPRYRNSEFEPKIINK